MTWRNKRVLVTGAASFIGSHLTEILLQRGSRVRALTQYHPRLPSAWLANMKRRYGARLEIQTGDLRDLQATSLAAQDASVIFHLASLGSLPYCLNSPLECFAINAQGAQNLLLAARAAPLKRFVLISTSLVYGAPISFPIREDSPVQADTPYAASKIAAEAAAMSFHRCYGLPITILRPFNIYGPRQTTEAVIPSIMRQILESREVLLGNLRPVKDFTYVEDAVGAFLAAAAHPAAIGQIFQIASGEAISIGNLAQKILGIAGKDTPIRTVKEKTRARRLDPKNAAPGVLADNAKIRRVLGWAPRTSLPRGLKRTWLWHARRKNR
ncbi:MAG: GDP-mannose 4,6-dehydratase [Elusimicrobia bacterium]|nr:GDP-mannose 4,6-dehydratase [Elusimicrobiota bacterium]